MRQQLGGRPNGREVKRRITHKTSDGAIGVVQRRVSDAIPIGLEVFDREAVKLRYDNVTDLVTLDTALLVGHDVSHVPDRHGFVSTEVDGAVVSQEAVDLSL